MYVGCVNNNNKKRDFYLNEIPLLPPSMKKWQNLTF